MPRITLNQKSLGLFLVLPESAVTRLLTAAAAATPVAPTRRHLFDQLADQAAARVFGAVRRSNKKAAAWGDSTGRMGTFRNGLPEHDLPTAGSPRRAIGRAPQIIYQCGCDHLARNSMSFSTKPTYERLIRGR
jgi:hypothetical protein